MTDTPISPEELDAMQVIANVANNMSWSEHIQFRFASDAREDVPRPIAEVQRLKALNTELEDRVESQRSEMRRANEYRHKGLL